LCAGSKKSQTRDIEIAIKYWEDYKKTKEKEA
jgi:putative component of toxin-antitoxin plasmid stabilization module